MRNLTGSSAHGALTQERKPQFLVDMIFGAEVKSTLLSRQEKVALQLMELRAKTASIRQSLPDWVKEGLVPPKRNPSPHAAVLTENIAKPADLHSCKDAVQISSSVRADLGFLVDFLPPTGQPRLQQRALENLILGVDSESVEPVQYVDIAAGEPHTFPGWQAAAGEDLRWSSTQPSMIGSLLAGLASALRKCFSNCLLAVAGACHSVLDCLYSKRNRV
jgi:hypothetical protein